MTLASCVLIGRPELALETISELVRKSEILRSAPIFAFHFPDTLSSAEIQEIEKISNAVTVVETTLPLPRYRDEEMFFSRKNDYARRFGRGRIGYLDMCFWRSNLFQEPVLHGFDYIVTFDDDSHFISSPDPYLRRAFETAGWIIASAGTWNTFSQRTLDVRMNLMSFTRDFLSQNSIAPRDSTLALALESTDEARFHSMDWSMGNFNVYNRQAFLTQDWFRWIYSVNLFGGAYRFRWSDIEVLGLYGRIYLKDHLLDLGMIDGGAYSPDRPGTKMIVDRGGSWLISALKHRLGLRRNGG